MRQREGPSRSARAGGSIRPRPTSRWRAGRKRRNLLRVLMNTRTGSEKHPARSSARSGDSQSFAGCFPPPGVQFPTTPRQGFSPTSLAFSSLPRRASLGSLSSAAGARFMSSSTSAASLRATGRCRRHPGSGRALPGRGRAATRPRSSDGSGIFRRASCARQPIGAGCIKHVSTRILALPSRDGDRFRTFPEPRGRRRDRTTRRESVHGSGIQAPAPRLGHRSCRPPARRPSDGNSSSARTCVLPPDRAYSWPGRKSVVASVRVADRR